MVARKGRHIDRPKIEIYGVLAIEDCCSVPVQSLVCTQQGLTRIR